MLRKKKDKKILNALVLPKKDLLVTLARVIMAFGFLIIFLSYVPSSYYAFLEAFGINISTKVLKQATAAPEVAEFKSFVPYEPAYDPDLPTENTLVISSIKLETPVHEAEESLFEDALRKGVWRVTNFGTPYDRSRPTILVAHRFGYLNWSIAYRLKNSFYNLPKTKVGDRVEIIWNQRKYVYEIYKEEEGYAINDYGASLVLYTCKDMTSEVKVFRYAKLLEL